MPDIVAERRESSVAHGNATPRAAREGTTASPSMGTPSHLSEFYSFVSPGAIRAPSEANVSPLVRPQSAASEQRANAAPGAGTRGHARNESKSSIMGIFRRGSFASLQTEGSTLGSAAFANVQQQHPDLPALITSSEMASTEAAIARLADAASHFRDALMVMSSAAAELGGALEAVSECKGAGRSADGLHAAGGLNYLVSNHQQVLARTIERTFEVPVRKSLAKLHSAATEGDARFRSEMKGKTREIKTREKELARLARKRTRNLNEYRNSLLELTGQIDDIDRLKYDYFTQTYDLVEQTLGDVLDRAACMARGQVEIYEGIARKGWSGGGLDDLIASCPDPFSMEEEEADEQENGSVGDSHGLFSVLPQSSILPQSSDPTDEEDDGGRDTIKGLEAFEALGIHADKVSDDPSNDDNDDDDNDHVAAADKANETVADGTYRDDPSTAGTGRSPEAPIQSNFVDEENQWSDHVVS